MLPRNVGMWSPIERTSCSRITDSPTATLLRKSLKTRPVNCFFIYLFLMWFQKGSSAYLSFWGGCNAEWGEIALLSVILMLIIHKYPNNKWHPHRDATWPVKPTLAKFWKFSYQYLTWLFYSYNEVKPFASFQEDFYMSGGYCAVVKGKKKSKTYKELTNYRACKNCPALFFHWKFNLVSCGQAVLLQDMTCWGCQESMLSKKSNLPRSI